MENVKNKINVFEKIHKNPDITFNTLFENTNQKS